MNTNNICFRREIRNQHFSDEKSTFIIGFLINMQVQGQHPHQWAPLPDSWHAARMADLTPDLQVRLS